jgi:hypothetical protein
MFWLQNDTEAPVSIMHLAFCTPNRKVGMMNCLFASFVGLASVFWCRDGIAFALLADAGGFLVFCRLLLVVAHRLACSLWTPTSASSS